MKLADRQKLEDEVRRRYRLLKDSMNERVARHWAATEAIAIGHSGVAIVARATGMAPRRLSFTSSSAGLTAIQSSFAFGG